jgi:hypothetical protein
VTGFRLQAVALLLLAGAIALHPILTPDLWWHLASGRWILENATVPQTDVLTYTESEHEWINLQWLTDVVLVSVWRRAGPDALVLLKAALVMLQMLLVLGAARAAGAGAGAAGAATALGVLALAERTLVRPEIVSGVCLATTLFVLLRWRRRGGRTVWALPFLCALWANGHSLAFLGPLMILWWAALEFAGRHGAERQRAGGEWRVLLGVGLVSAVALLLNPYGFAVWRFPVTLFQRISGDVQAFTRILEFAPPWQDAADPALRFFWVLLAATAGSFFLSRPAARAARLLAVLPFLALALLARRNIPLFVIVAVPFLAANLSDGARRFVTSRRATTVLRAAPIAVALLLTVAVLAGASPVLFGLWRDRGLGVEPGLFPGKCVETLRETGERGRVFHAMDFGGYLAWADPSQRTFIDGRLEVAGADWLARYIEAHENPAVWELLRSSWNIEVLLLQHSSPGAAAFLLARLREGAWRPICYSPEAALLFANDPWLAHADIPVPAKPRAEDWERVLREEYGPAPGAGQALGFFARPLDRAVRLLRRGPPIAPVRRTMRYANLCLTLGWLPEARAGYEKTLSVAPRDPEALLNLGICNVREGRPEAARRCWQAALDIVPRDSRKPFEEALARLPQ